MIDWDYERSRCWFPRAESAFEEGLRAAAHPGEEPADEDQISHCENREVSVDEESTRENRGAQVEHQMRDKPHSAGEALAAVGTPRDPDGWKGLHCDVWNALLDCGLPVAEADVILDAIAHVLPASAVSLPALQAERDAYQRGCEEWNEKFEVWRSECAQRADKAEADLTALRASFELLNERYLHWLGRAEEAEDTLTALRAALQTLKPYLSHKPGCDQATHTVRLNGECRCTCGLATLLAVPPASTEKP